MSALVEISADANVSLPGGASASAERDSTGVPPLPALEPFAYDRLPYPGFPYSQTHPGRLATLAALHGMEPAPPARCRVLELGCGDGGNLIPMAYQFPDSDFLGIDLSARAIETGRQTVAELGLRNIDLRAIDMGDVTPELGRFDYIIAHGVYSWVPPAIRAKMLSIYGSHLAPQGVAFVSYNCHPGSYLRDLSRAIMLFHVRDVVDPQQRVQQARMLLQTLAEMSDEKDIYGLVMRSQYERIRKIQPHVLYHDDLDAGATAFFLYQVLEEASRHGLQYLSDATAPIMTGRLLELQGEPKPVVKLLEQIPEEDWTAREQYLDFIKGRMFRETLLCRHDVKLRRPVAAERIKDFHLSTDIVPASADLDPQQPGAAEFKTRAGQRVSTDHALGKAALLHLGAVWPQAIAFADLIAGALERLGPAAEPVRERLDEQVQSLTEILFRSFCAGLVEVEAFAPPLAATISERPQASRLARKQAKAGPILTSLRHGTVVLDDAVTRSLLGLLDGTRTVDQLVPDLTAAVAATVGESGGSEDAAAGAPIISRENVVRNLQLLARLALLEA